MDLQQLLNEEMDNIIQSQKQETLTFEKDPIEYIIQRYPSLDATMVDLMTTSYKDYITGLYVMAPKPTTFKVLLHNGQSFYLIYNERGYTAKISGKQYQLIQLNNQEHAIKAISRLLLMGIPPSAAGPEEQEGNDGGYKDTFASDMTSEPDLNDLSDFGSEGSPTDEPDEPEEELQEDIEEKPKKFRIIK